MVTGKIQHSEDFGLQQNCTLRTIASIHHGVPRPTAPPAVAPALHADHRSLRVRSITLTLALVRPADPTLLPLSVVLRVGYTWTFNLHPDRRICPDHISPLQQRHHHAAAFPRSARRRACGGEDAARSRGEWSGEAAVGGWCGQRWAGRFLGRRGGSTSWGGDGTWR